MSYDDEDASTILFGLLMLFLTLPFSAAWKGFVLSKLWLWFIVPFGLEPIGVLQAIGLSLAVSMFSGSKKMSSDDDKPFMLEVGEALLFSFLWPLLVLIFGAVVHSFM